MGRVGHGRFFGEPVGDRREFVGIGVIEPPGDIPGIGHVVGPLRGILGLGHVAGPLAGFLRLGRLAGPLGGFLGLGRLARPLDGFARLTGLAGPPSGVRSSGPLRRARFLHEVAGERRRPPVLGAAIAILALDDDRA